MGSLSSFGSSDSTNRISLSIEDSLDIGFCARRSTIGCIRQDTPELDNSCPISLREPEEFFSKDTFGATAVTGAAPEETAAFPEENRVSSKEWCDSIDSSSLSDR